MYISAKPTIAKRDKIRYNTGAMELAWYSTFHYTRKVFLCIAEEWKRQMFKPGKVFQSAASRWCRENEAPFNTVLGVPGAVFLFCGDAPTGNSFPTMTVDDWPLGTARPVASIRLVSKWGNPVGEGQWPSRGRGTAPPLQRKSIKNTPEKELYSTTGR